MIQTCLTSDRGYTVNMQTVIINQNTKLQSIDNIQLPNISNCQISVL